MFLLSKTNNEDIAEELTQETFFQAVQCIDKFKGNSSILTWLCGIAKNVWLKDLRKRQKIRLISNLTFAEIGEIIGKTENWTRVTFYRGKQKIVKEILKR